MKIFKSVDEKIAELGFRECEHDKYGIVYERNNGLYIHRVALLHKASGRHILQSYDPALPTTPSVGNIGVGLTYKELVLFAKKMKQIGLN